MTSSAATILVVDDEPQNRKLLEAMLQPEGYLTLSAANGADALARIAEHAPDLILLDIMMPGMDGYQVAKTLKADPATANIPIIMVTALDDPSTRLAGLNAGAEDFLTKPVDRAELWLRVRNLLRLKALADLLLEHSQLLEQQVQARTVELQLFRNAMDTTGDAITLINRTTMQFIEVNQTACNMFGYTREELLQQSPPQLSATSLEDMEQLFDKIISGERAMVLSESQLQCKDGSLLPVEIHQHAQRYGDDWIIVSVARDITERKRAVEELRRLNWALLALSQGNTALIHSSDEAELFQSCCKAITGAGGYPLAWIGLIKQDSEHSVDIAFSSGEAIDFMSSIKSSWQDEPLSLGLTRSAIQSCTTQVNNDFALNPELFPWFDKALANGLASQVSLPITNNAEVIGVLNIYGRETGAFGDNEVRLFEQLAGDISYGIGNRRTQQAYQESLLQRHRDAEQLRATFESAIGALGTMVEQRDPYTAGHQRRVAEITVAIGRELGLDDNQLEGLRISSIIHDIGKISVPAEILARPGKLSDAEFMIVREHAQAGYEIVKGVDFPWPVAQTILQHHERIDGSGYPQGLKGEQIILEARILAVADVVEAMSSHRPYRAGLGIDAALAVLIQEAGTKLDAKVVAAFQHLFWEKGFKLPV